MSKTKTPSAKQAILEVLKVEPRATVAQIAVSAGVGRSTVGKQLAQMESEGQVRRTAGGRDGNRRLPDVWSLAGVETPSASAAHAPDRTAASDQPAEPAGKQPGTPAAKSTDRRAGESAPVGGTPQAGKLKPGGLKPLVLAYLQEHADKPRGPSEIANALERSSGAVANCLNRLVEAKQVKLVNEKPRQYSLSS